MITKSCFILAAGYGSRMGKIGKVLPKILWPVFEKTLLEIQISRAKKLGFEKIYINAHHCADQIKSILKKKELDLDVLTEESLLDSGGAFYNLKEYVIKNSFDTNIFFINGDIIQNLDHEKLVEAESLLEKNGIVLVGKDVTSPNRYNRIDIENGRLKGITLAEEVIPPYQTYSGMGFLDLNGLTGQTGPSRFFDTVANFREREVRVFEAGNYGYFDYGTKVEYIENMFQALEANELHDILLDSEAIMPKKIDMRIKSYNSNSPGVINLKSGDSIDFDHRCIMMGGELGDLAGEGLYYDGIFDTFE